MRQILFRAVLLGVVILPLSSMTYSQVETDAEEPVSYVDPFIGTGAGGNTIPGATLPFGMMQWSPDTSDRGWYRYKDKTLRGFSLTHLSGVGCAIYADVPVLPWVGAVQESSTSPADLVMGFAHDQETARPGYYSVVTADGVKTELTVSTRAGIARITFPNGHPRTLLIKASESATALMPRRSLDETQVEVRADGAVLGRVESGGFCGGQNRYTLYFVLVFQPQAETHGVWTDAVQPGASLARGHRVGAYVTIPAGSEPVLVKAGISFVSRENAEANLHAEIAGWDFDSVRKQAHDQWAETLQHARVKGGTKDDLTQFYTALYHSLQCPNIFSDENGDYIGFDGRVRRLGSGEAQYANFSDWDIYRNTIQIQAWLFPERTSQMLESLVRDAEQSGWLPRWPAANDVTYAMHGDSPADVITSGYAFGAQAFDTAAALKFMVHSATTPGIGPHGGSERPYLEEYLKNGYVTSGTGGDREIAASMTLEYASTDFAVSRMAEALGDHSDAEFLLKHAQNWRSLFDPESTLIRPRMADGSFVTGWDPDHNLPHRPNSRDKNQYGFEEGVTLQYSWMIPFNYAGVIAAMGGDEKVLPRLEKFFSKVTGWGVPTFTVANEPDFCVPYVYLWTSQPWKVAEVVDKIRKEAFHTGPEGLPGNDDLGATSGVYLWSALGVYPVMPGEGAVALGSPLFQHAVLELGGSKRLEINRQGEGIYVQSVRLNGKAQNSAWLPLDKLQARTNRLDFKMVASPNKSWATRPEDRPPSFDVPNARGQ